MHKLFARNTYFVREHVGILKAANSYDIADLESREPLLECREIGLGVFTKILRFTDYKQKTPFNVELKTVEGGGGQLVLRIKRGWAFFRSTVEIFDGNEQLVGKFRQRLLSLGGKFDVLDPSEQVICQVEGSWKNFDYKFSRNGEPVALLTKKWMGLGKELFTSADNYVINIESTVSATDSVRQLVIAAAICIDMVFNE